MNKQDLLFEIGCEELPVDYIAPALRQLQASAEAKLKEARLEYGQITCEATPRRLVLMVAQLTLAQPELDKEVQGPATAVAYKPDGSLTPAGEGFLRKYGLTVAQVETRDGRLFAKVRETGKPTAELLPEILQALIKSLTFPKSMRWEASQARFARPIRWLVALLGTEVIPVCFADVKAGRTTYLHPLNPQKTVELKSPAEYADALKKGSVVLSVAQRRAALKSLLDQVVAATAQGGRLVADEKLLDMVVMMAEQPGVVLGRFKESYLHIAREIVVTAMREHQRYFAVEDAQGKLLPLFLAVYDNPLVVDPLNIRPGCERVLEARLKDAEFFFREDMKKPLASLVPELERVLWIKGLGSLLDKTKRLEALSGWLAEKLEPASKDFAKAAAHLSKADLITNMVQEKEFTSLQGIMGSFYALAQGEREEVARAIREQYQPRTASDACPITATGRVLALADKLDNLVGCWGAGFIPTGAKDPYALRRAAQGIVAIILDAGYPRPEHPISLNEILKQAIIGFDQFKDNYKELIDPIKDFILGRMETELANRQFRPDEIQAVLGAQAQNLTAIVKKAEAIRILRQQTGFSGKMTTFSRVINILPKSMKNNYHPDNHDILPTTINCDLFKVEVESELYDAAIKVHQIIRPMLESNNFVGMFDHLSTLLPLINRFFEDVMVMDKDELVKNNRLHLLSYIERLLKHIADFSRLVITE
jgi:glycyl-tRNA synthetase beta chain